MMRLLIRFLALRSVALGSLAAFAGFFISGYDVSVVFGVLLGAFISIYRTRLFGLFLKNAAEMSGIAAKSIIFQVCSQLLVFGLLIASIITGTTLFLGIAAGLLTVPTVIFINALTEGAGLTRNRWGGATERGES